MTASSYLPITIKPTKTFHEYKNTIYLSIPLINHWGIHPEDDVQVCIGSKIIPVIVSKRELEKDTILISEHLLAEINLPLKEIRFLTKYNRKGKTIFFGPIVALVTEFAEPKEIDVPSFGSVHSFCEELHHCTTIIGGLFYVFHIKNFAREAIEGFYYDEDGWKKDLLIPPNVIYNRIHSRKIESSMFFQRFLDEMNLLQIPIFNERFLSKWDVHEILNSEIHLQPYLPETALLDENQLSLFLNTYEDIYIKPINGSQGRNIIRVHKKVGQLIVQTSSGKERINRLEFENEDHFLHWFRSYKSARVFLVQQTIPLLKIHNRSLDFRVLCHKNHQNRWRINSTIARISAEKQFVSNISRGGETLRPIKALSELFNRKHSLQQLTLMKEISIEIATIIDQSSNGLIGELGIDLGVDQEGKLWIIEVNSKPSKNFEEQKGKVRPSAKAILEYSTALAFQHFTG